MFESWYACRHLEHLGLPASLVAETFSSATFANGLLAICAGMMANAAAETPLRLGPTAPFLLAVPCFAGCFAVVAAAWDENYGNQARIYPGSVLPTYRKTKLRTFIHMRPIQYIAILHANI